MFRTYSGCAKMAALAAVLSVGCAEGTDSSGAGAGGVTGISGTDGVSSIAGAVGVAGVVAGTGGAVGGAGIAGIGAKGGGGVAGTSGGGSAVGGGGGTIGFGARGGAAGMAGRGGGLAGGGAGGSGPSSSGCGQSAQTGTFQAKIDAFGLARSYFMSVPKSYDPNIPQRLVFGFHGSGYTGQRMRDYLGLEAPPLLDGTIFVYPDGLPLQGDPSNTAWELGENQRDIAFFDTLYQSLRSTYCIDEARVFANGQSYGGLMTNAVGCLRGDVLRAIAVVAGSGPYSTCKGQVAVWITHGVDDTYVPYSSGEASRDRWVAANHCASTTTPGNPSQCQNYDGCDAGHPVIWCPHENDGGHQHPSFGRAAVREFLVSF